MLRRLGITLGMAVLAWSGPAAAQGPRAATAPESTPELKGLPQQTLKILIPNGGYKGDANVLDFSGMVYDHHRHKILAFGGGHATARFPNSVHEFDPVTLKWTALTPDVPPGEYVAANAVKTAEGLKLGGVKWQGKQWAGSRHTYDGLVVLPDKDVMVSVQAQEFQSGACPPDYAKDYQGGSGLWTFDPVKKEWSVSEKAGCAVGYCYADVSPKRPELIYFGSAFNDAFFCLNVKTLEVKKLADRISASAGSDMSMTWYPEKDTFLAFPSEPSGKTGVRVIEYDPARNIWADRKAEGEAPNTYSINVPYDSANKVFVCFNNGFCHYYSPMENKWYKLDKKLEMKRLYHHHVYDPVNNVHIAVGGQWETYAFKLSDEPGKLPGTGLPKK